MKIVLPKSLERIQISNNAKSGRKQNDGITERNNSGKPFTKVVSKFSHIHNKQSQGGHSVIDGVIYLGN